MTMGCCGETDFEKLATNEELDKLPGETSLAFEDIAEEGTFDETGGELGRADVEDALANL